jgi:hypothetical protein
MQSGMPTTDAHGKQRSRTLDASFLLRIVKWRAPAQF